VPSDSWGYGIVRLSQVVNATAFPVPAGAPDPVYARYLAWLKTPQGQAVARQVSRESAMAGQPAAAGRHSFRVPAAGVVAGSVLLLAALAALLLARSRRRGGGGRARRAARDALAASASVPEWEASPPSGEEFRPRITFGTQDPPTATMPRIPPYLPVPSPKRADAANRGGYRAPRPL
jgi:hypothetical protein